MIWCPLKVKPALPARSERGRNGKVGERRRENLKEVNNDVMMVMMIWWWHWWWGWWARWCEKRAREKWKGGGEKERESEGGRWVWWWWVWVWWWWGWWWWWWCLVEILKLEILTYHVRWRRRGWWGQGKRAQGWVRGRVGAKRGQELTTTAMALQRWGRCYFLLDIMYYKCAWNWKCMEVMKVSIIFLQRQSLSDYERIKEREKELERIHRRSRWPNKKFWTPNVQSVIKSWT